MSSFGKHTQLTFVDDDTTIPISASNLNEIERVVKLADTELSSSKETRFNFYKDYFYSTNVIEVDAFGDNSSWSAAASTTVSSDTTNNLLGAMGVKFLENDSTASYIGMYKTISSKDLTEFPNGESSSDDDLVCITFYISDYTKFSQLTFKFGTDNSDNYSVQYIPNTQFTRNGWHTLFPAKSDFSSNGTPPGWDDITYIRCEAYTDTASLNEYVTMQLMQVVRESSIDSGYPSFTTRHLSASTDENIYYINNDVFSLYYDDSIKKVGLMRLDQYNHTNNEIGLLIYEDVVEFVAKIEGYCKKEGYFPSLTWYVNSENYVECYIAGSNISVRVREKSVSQYYTLSLGTTLLKNERIELVVEKHGQAFQFKCKKGNNVLKSYEFTVDIDLDDEGDVYLGHYGDNSFGIVTDFVVSNKQNSFFDTWLTPKILKNETIESSVNNSTYVEVNDIDVYLTGNGLFEIELNLVYNSASNTPDIQFYWTATNVELLGGRNVKGMAYTGTNSSAYQEGKSSSYDDFTDVVILGTSSGPNYGREKFLCRTGVAGGKLIFNFQQRTTDAGNPTYVRKETYVKITKVSY